MMREDKFVQVYVTISKENNETQYLFTVHPNRHKKYFDPVHIGTLTIDSENHFNLRTATEWGTGPQKREIDARLASLFSYSINKCLTELLTYDVPELSFLAGKLQYREIDKVAMDWSKAHGPLKLLNALFPTDKEMGVPYLHNNATYVLQIVEEPIPITDNIFLRSIMPINGGNFGSVNEGFYFAGEDIKQLKKYLWWELILPETISQEEFEDHMEGRIKGLIYRKEGRLIYTNSVETAEDLPFSLWLYIKKRYNIMPSFYDEDSFETARTLSLLQGEL
ncbi:MAG TPA: hypothetical protein PKI14_12150 [Fervidobacterium sp.]|nr:hypothetical protein [Dictyoglomaceae bacterium]HUM43689.1 hypothetical protein [Fervidobacterium sp.]